MVGFFLGGLMSTVWAVGTAADHKIHVMEVWARATPPGAVVGATYFVVHNQGQQPDSLIGVQSPIADKAEMHTSVMQGDLMTMEKLDSVPLNPDAPIIFKPGGQHVMLMGLDSPLVEGDSFPLTLMFENAGPIEAMVVILGMGAMGHDQPGSTHEGHTHSSE